MGRSSRDMKRADRPRRPGTGEPITQAAGAAGRPVERPRRAHAHQTSRTARAQAAKRRRWNFMVGGGTGLVVILIIIIALIVNNANSSSGGTGLANPSDLNPASSTLAVGSTAPNFTLKTLDGKSYSLSSLRGHPVLLEFFAIWCPHCQAMAPVLNRLETAYNPKGLKVLAVLANPYGRNYESSGSTTPANKSDLTWFEQHFAVQHPSLIDPTFAVTNQYGANSYPTIYVLDKKGVVRSATQGEVPYAQLASVITAANK